MCGWRQALLGSNLSSAKTIDALKKKGLGFTQVFFCSPFFFRAKKLKKPIHTHLGTHSKIFSFGLSASFICSIINSNCLGVLLCKLWCGRSSL